MGVADSRRRPPCILRRAHRAAARNSGQMKLAKGKPPCHLRMQEGPKRELSPALASGRQRPRHAAAGEQQPYPAAGSWDPRSPPRSLRALASALAPGARSPQRWPPARAPDLFTNSPAPGDPEPSALPRGPFPLAAPPPPAQRRASWGSVLGPCARPAANGV